MTRFVLRHRRLVVAFWLVVTVVGVASVGSATKALSTEYSVPGRAVLVPALVALLGRANWLLPAPIVRLLRVTQSPVAVAAPARS